MLIFSLFKGPVIKEVKKTLVALCILAIANLIYLFLTGHMSHFIEHKLAYITMWVTIAFVLGVTLVYNDKNDQQTKRDFVCFGILVALLIYVPAFSWLKSVGNITGMQFIYFSSFGIVITAISSLFTYIISEKY